MSGTNKSPRMPLGGRSAFAAEDLIVRGIRNGDYAIGRYLPSLRELSRDCGLATETFRRALLRLQDAGASQLVIGRDCEIIGWCTEEEYETAFVPLFQSRAVPPGCRQEREGHGRAGAPAPGRAARESRAAGVSNPRAGAAAGGSEGELSVPNELTKTHPIRRRPVRKTMMQVSAADLVGLRNIERCRFEPEGSPCDSTLQHARTSSLPSKETTSCLSNPMSC